MHDFIVFIIMAGLFFLVLPMLQGEVLDLLVEYGCKAILMVLLLIFAIVSGSVVGTLLLDHPHDWLIGAVIGFLVIAYLRGWLTSPEPEIISPQSIEEKNAVLAKEKGNKIEVSTQPKSRGIDKGELLFYGVFIGFFTVVGATSSLDAALIGFIFTTLVCGVTALIMHAGRGGSNGSS